MAEVESGELHADMELGFNDEEAGDEGGMLEPGVRGVDTLQLGQLGQLAKSATPQQLAEYMAGYVLGQEQLRLLAEEAAGDPNPLCKTAKDLREAVRRVQQAAGLGTGAGAHVAPPSLVVAVVGDPGLGKSLIVSRMVVHNRPEEDDGAADDALPNPEPHLTSQLWAWNPDAPQPHDVVNHAGYTTVEDAGMRERLERPWDSQPLDDTSAIRPVVAGVEYACAVPSGTGDHCTQKLQIISQDPDNATFSMVNTYRSAEGVTALFNQVREALLTGKLPAGDQLSQSDLLTALCMAGVDEDELKGLQATGRLPRNLDVSDRDALVDYVLDKLTEEEGELVEEEPHRSSGGGADKAGLRCWVEQRLQPLKRFQECLGQRETFTIHGGSFRQGLEQIEKLTQQRWLGAANNAFLQGDVRMALPGRLRLMLYDMPGSTTASTTWRAAERSAQLAALAAIREQANEDDGRHFVLVLPLTGRGDNYDKTLLVLKESGLLEAILNDPSRFHLLPFLSLHDGDQILGRKWDKRVQEGNLEQAANVLELKLTAKDWRRAYENALKAEADALDEAEAEGAKAARNRSSKERRARLHDALNNETAMFYTPIAVDVLGGLLEKYPAPPAGKTDHLADYRFATGFMDKITAIYEVAKRDHLVHAMERLVQLLVECCLQTERLFDIFFRSIDGYAGAAAARGGHAANHTGDGQDAGDEAEGPSDAELRGQKLVQRLITALRALVQLSDAQSLQDVGGLSVKDFFNNLESGVPEGPGQERVPGLLEKALADNNKAAAEAQLLVEDCSKYVAPRRRILGEHLTAEHVHKTHLPQLLMSHVLGLAPRGARKPEETAKWQSIVTRVRLALLPYLEVKLKGAHDDAMSKMRAAWEAIGSLNPTDTNAMSLVREDLACTLTKLRKRLMDRAKRFCKNKALGLHAALKAAKNDTDIKNRLKDVKRRGRGNRARVDMLEDELMGPWVEKTVKAVLGAAKLAANKLLEEFVEGRDKEVKYTVSALKSRLRAAGSTRAASVGEDAQEDGEGGAEALAAHRSTWSLAAVVASYEIAALLRGTRKNSIVSKVLEDVEKHQKLAIEALAAQRRVDTKLPAVLEAIVLDPIRRQRYEATLPMAKKRSREAAELDDMEPAQEEQGGDLLEAGGSGEARSTAGAGAGTSSGPLSTRSRGGRRAGNLDRAMQAGPAQGAGDAAATPGSCPQCGTVEDLDLYPVEACEDLGGRVLCMLCSKYEIRTGRRRTPQQERARVAKKRSRSFHVLALVAATATEAQVPAPVAAAD